MPVSPFWLPRKSRLIVAIVSFYRSCWLAKLRPAFTLGLIGLALFLSGCARGGDQPAVPPGNVFAPFSPSPTPRPLATDGFQEPLSGTAAVGDLDGPQTRPADPVPLAPLSKETKPTPLPQAPPGSGIRPSEAILHRSPEAGLESPVDWRPPPVPVPHALHPDDHYWMVRPIASDRRNYELEWYPYGNRPTKPEALPYRIHHGMDFPNEPGTTVFAAGSGTVIWAGPLPSNRDGINYYGNTVVIHHDWLWQGQDVYTLYAHTIELFVKVGDYVQQGQLIAGVGATGHVSGPHLHLEVRVGQNNYNSVRNPVLWLAPYEGWGTLAGRFMDNRGELIHGAMVSVLPARVESNAEVGIRRQQTYAPDGPNGDDIWQENFAFGDLPAGDYLVILNTAGETFRREVTVKPEQTNFIIVQADFNWFPTATPTPTLAPMPAPLATPEFPFP